MALSYSRAHEDERDYANDSDPGHDTTYAPITPATMSGIPSGFQSSVATGRSSYDASADNRNLVKHAPDDTGTEVESATSATTPQDQWKAGKQEWLIVLCLATVSLMVALDATIVVTPLPVSVSRSRVDANHLYHD